MGYIVIGICLIAIVAIGARIFFKPKSKATVTPTVSVSPKEDEELSLSAPQGESAHDLVIQVEMLPAEAISEEGSLVEITDSKVLARVNNLIPNLVQAGNAVNNAVQAVEAQGEVLYRAIIPAGAKLTNSRGMEGAVRGFYRGADGIQGHANLVAVEAQKGSAVVANTSAAAMGVASMVVGQYYMTQINAELGQISDGISKISDFQDNEYRSRVFSLVSHVKTIAEFQVEILENDELRLSKIAQLDSLEEECTKLLGQANLTLAGFAKKTDLDFEAYEKELQEAQNWYIYQNTLLEMLYKISDLRFTLHLGAVSREQCTALLPPYTQQVEETQTRLSCGQPAHRPPGVPRHRACGAQHRECASRHRAPHRLHPGLSGPPERGLTPQKTRGLSGCILTGRVGLSKNYLIACPGHANSMGVRLQTSRILACKRFRSWKVSGFLAGSRSRAAG